MAGGEETSVYDAICINPCKWFEQALKATLRCLGFDSVITSESTQAQEEEECLIRTEPLIMQGPNGSSDDHKDKKEDHQGQADLNPSTTEPGSTDPTSESSDPSVRALGRSRMPPRPPVSTGRGGQTN